MMINITGVGNVYLILLLVVCLFLQGGDKTSTVLSLGYRLLLICIDGV